MKTTWKYLILIISLLLVISLGSCGKPKAELIYWQSVSDSDKVLIANKMIDTYNKTNADFQVKLYAYQSDVELRDALDNALKSGKLPDVISISNSSVSKFISQDKVVCLDDLIKEDNSFKKENIYSGLFEQGMYEGKLYSLPFRADCLAVYYHKSHFANSGIDPASIKTWNDLSLAAKKLTNEGRFGIMLPAGPFELSATLWQTFFLEAGGEFFDQTSNNLAFNSKEGIETLQYWKMLVDNKSATLSDMNSQVNMDNFISGKVSVWIDRAWNLTKEGIKKNEDIGVFPIPANKKRVTFAEGERIYIFKTTADRQKGAWEFEKFVTSADFQTEWSMNTFNLPICTDALSNKEYQDFLSINPNLKVFVDSMDYAAGRPYIANYSQISNMLGSNIHDVLLGKTDAKAALDKVVEKSIKIIEGAN
ncbi:MAG: hypothetical protein A2Y21_03615 [Clostridiales bacterium GWC2_40_7]|nr:MAG: hypothetical protein A2Y21_03615 [Clostridiales bacterium GWC2_40_7]